MNIKQAIQSVYKNYFNFKGRSRRSEFWYFGLFIFLIQILLALLTYILPESIAAIFGIFASLFTLFNCIPSWAVSFRRLHDAGKSAWNSLWFLLPLLGAIYLLFLYCKPSDGPNKWGIGPISPGKI